MTMPINI